MADKRKPIIVKGAQFQKLKKGVDIRERFIEEFKKAAEKIHNDFWELAEELIPETANGNWMLEKEHADAGIYIFVPIQGGPENGAGLSSFLEDLAS